MAIQEINIGSGPNTGTGEPIRDAFSKVNENFVQIESDISGIEAIIINNDNNDNVAAKTGVPKIVQDKLLFLADANYVSENKLYNFLGTNYLDVINNNFFRVPWNYGAELVTNSTFDTSEQWLLENATIGSGVVSLSNAPAGSGIYLRGLFTTDKKYEITYEIKNYVSGYLFVTPDQYPAGALRNANGAYKEIIVGNGADMYFWTFGDATSLQIDNVHIKEVSLATSILAADSDLLWADADGVPNNVSLTKLAAFDYNTTVVKYRDKSPHDVSLIGIMKSEAVLENYEEDLLYSAFSLSIFRGHSYAGYLKDNRSIVHTSLSEMVVNGKFKTDTTWTKDPGWRIGSYEAYCDKTNEGGIYKLANILVSGARYLVSFEITRYVSGAVRFRCDLLQSFDGIFRSAVGIYEEEFTYAPGYSPGYIELRTGETGFVGSITNFSIIQL